MLSKKEITIIATIIGAEVEDVVFSLAERLANAPKTKKGNVPKTTLQQVVEEIFQEGAVHA